MIGVKGLDGGMSELVGELEGEGEKRVAGRRFLRKPPAETLPEGSLIGVKAAPSGWKMLNDFLLLLSGIVRLIQYSSLLVNCSGWGLHEYSKPRKEAVAVT